ncbi:hypothetical protein HK405_011567 [Cladochytrium tenue]|nr:hypothetical protein HK405_011567 [Cladochytrium tenue]
MIGGHLKCLKWTRDQRTVSFGLDMEDDVPDASFTTMDGKLLTGQDSKIYLTMLNEMKSDEEQYQLLAIPSSPSSMDDLYKMFGPIAPDGSEGRDDQIRESVVAATSLFDEMTNSGHYPGIILYDLLMNAHISRGEYKKAIGLFKSFVKSSETAGGLTVPDLRIYTALVVALIESGDVHSAYHFMMLLKDREIASPDVVMYTALIDGYGKKGDISAMKSVFSEMVDAGIQPNTTTYGALLNAYCRVGNMLAAHELYEDMREKRIRPNLIIFNTLIHGYGKAKDLHGAAEVYNEMRKRGARPSTTTYNILMASHIRAGSIDGAMKWYEKMSRQSRSSSQADVGKDVNSLQHRRASPWRNGDVRPNLVTYNLLVWANARNKNAFAASDTVSSMIKQGFKPDMASFTPIVKMHASKGDWASAVEVARRLEAAAGAAAVEEAPRSSLPLIPGTTSKAAGAGPVSVIDRGPLLHLAGTRDSGVIPYDATAPYNIIMSELLRRKDLRGAQGIFEWVDRIAHENHAAEQRPDGDELGSEQPAGGSGSDLDGGGGEVAAAAAPRLDPSPDLHTFDMVVRMHGLRGDSAGARYWVDEALRRGLRPDTRLFNSLMAACLACKDYDGVEAAYALMKDSGVVPDMASMAWYARARRDRVDLVGAEAEEEEGGGGTAGAGDGNREAPLNKAPHG